MRTTSANQPSCTMVHQWRCSDYTIFHTDSALMASFVQYKHTSNRARSTAPDGPQTAGLRPSPPPLPSLAEGSAVLASMLFSSWDSPLPACMAWLCVLSLDDSHALLSAGASSDEPQLVPALSARLPSRTAPAPAPPAPEINCTPPAAAATGATGASPTATKSGPAPPTPAPTPLSSPVLPAPPAPATSDPAGTPYCAS